MSTRSAIVLRLPKGTYAAIYCHNDGYPDGPHGVGYTLLNHYKGAEIVKQLIELGDLSSLGQKLEPNPKKPHGFGRGESAEPQDGVTVAYMRDRGEKDCEAATGTDLKALLAKIDHEYAYVFENGSWTCNGRPLEEVVAEASKA